MPSRDVQDLWQDDVGRLRPACRPGDAAGVRRRPLLGPPQGGGPQPVQPALRPQLTPDPVFMSLLAIPLGLLIGLSLGTLGGRRVDPHRPRPGLRPGAGPAHSNHEFAVYRRGHIPHRARPARSCGTSASGARYHLRRPRYRWLPGRVEVVGVRAGTPAPAGFRWTDSPCRLPDAAKGTTRCSGTPGGR